MAPYFELLQANDARHPYLEVARRMGFKGVVSRVLWIETDTLLYQQRLKFRASKVRGQKDPPPEMINNVDGTQRIKHAEDWSNPKQLAFAPIIILYREIDLNPKDTSKETITVHHAVVNSSTPQERIDLLYSLLGPDVFADEYRERTLRKLFGPKQFHVASTGKINEITPIKKA